MRRALTPDTDDGYAETNTEPQRDLTLHQWAPHPTILADLVRATRYRNGWTFVLEDIIRDQDHGRGSAGGLTLVITTLTTDSYNPRVCDLCHSAETRYRVHHYFPIPAATYDERSWRHWLFDCIVKVETHEAAEFFKLWNSRAEHDEETAFYDRPYAPSHGPGNDPYLLREVGTDLDRRTRFTGEVAS